MSNKGKKYKKLQGFEQATPESERAATAFMDWYGANFERIKSKLIFGHLFDDELATDTALMIYDNIALKGTALLDYQFYFLRAYHTNRIAKAKRVNYETPIIEHYNHFREERVYDYEADPFDATERLRNRIFSKTETLDFDYERYELTVDQLTTEMLDYVRGKYEPFAVSLFEIYVGLLPDTSYKRLSKMLGIPRTKVWTSIGPIRKDLAERFQSRKSFLLSVI
jgi:hypothetical protein